MKLPTTDLRLDFNLERLVYKLSDLLSRTNQQVNQSSEGQITAVHNARTAAPTTGTYKQGDQIRKVDPVEAGAAASKYVIIGWVCTASGTPGTWLEMRTLTGN